MILFLISNKQCTIKSIYKDNVFTFVQFEVFLGKNKLILKRNYRLAWLRLFLPYFRLAKSDNQIIWHYQKPTHLIYIFIWTKLWFGNANSTWFLSTTLCCFLWVSFVGFLVFSYHFKKFRYSSVLFVYKIFECFCSMHGGKYKSIALSCNIVTMFLTMWCSCAGATSFPVYLSHILLK